MSASVSAIGPLASLMAVSMLGLSILHLLAAVTREDASLRVYVVLRHIYGQRGLRIAGGDEVHLDLFGGDIPRREHAWEIGFHLVVHQDTPLLQREPPLAYRAYVSLEPYVHQD